jgi:hypothetical protein
MSLTAEQRAAAIQAVLDHGLTPQETSAAATAGKLPGRMGAELEPFEIAEHEVFDAAHDFDFEAFLIAQMRRHKRDGIEQGSNAEREASWVFSAERSTGREV